MSLKASQVKVVQVIDPLGDEMMPEVQEVYMRSTGSDDEVEILGP